MRPPSPDNAAVTTATPNTADPPLLSPQAEPTGLKALAKTVRDRTPLGAFVGRGAKLAQSLGMPVPQRVWSHLPYRGVTTARAPGSDRRFRMRSHGHVIENELHWIGLAGRERTSFDVWAKLAATDKLVLDIGANTGLFSLIAGAMQPSRPVVAFEPLDRIARLARENAALNPEFALEIQTLAIGGEDGAAAIYDPGGSQPSSASLVAGYLDMKVEAVEVPVRTLDSWLAARHEAGQPHEVGLMKIDVEGHEAAVFDGMPRTLREQRPAIVVEAFDPASPVYDTFRSLVADGWRVYDLAWAGPEDISDALRAPSDRNLLLIPQERVAMLGISEPAAASI